MAARLVGRSVGQANLGQSLTLIVRALRVTALSCPGPFPHSDWTGRSIGSTRQCIPDDMHRASPSIYTACLVCLVCPPSPSAHTHARALGVCSLFGMIIAGSADYPHPNPLTEKTTR